MKITDSRATRSSPSCRPSPAPPPPAAPSRRSSGVQLTRRGRRDRAARHRHGDRPARAARGRGRPRRAPSCCRRGCSLDVVRALPADEVTLELRAAPSRTSRSSPAPATFHLRTLPPRGLPAASRSPRATARRRCPAPALRRDDRRRSPASASRDETRPVLTGILVSASGERAADGRHRLLPAGVKETELEAPLERRASRPTCRRGRCRSWRGSSQRRRRDARGLACARTRSSSRSAASCCPRG